MFQALSELLDRWRALRGQRVIDKQYSKDFDRLFMDRISLAQEAAAAGNRKRALAIWQELRGPFATQAAISQRVLDLLMTLEAFDEADAMMEEGRKLYPHFEHFAKGYVQIAFRRGDLEETLRRCDLVRAKFPCLADGYTLAAACLTKLGRHDEAEAIIERAVHKVPPGLNLLVGHARHAERCEDWPEALRRWELVRTKFDNIQGFNGIARSLRQLGRLDEAEMAAMETRERFPTDPWAFVTLAAIAKDRGDLDEAARRWETARRQCPFFHLAYKAGAEAERRLGREEKAEEILSSGVTMIRGDLDLHLEYARSAHRRRDWAAAAERWTLVRERFPECDEARERLAEALAATEVAAPSPAACRTTFQSAKGT